MPTVELALATVKSVADMITELAKLAQTDEGRKWLDRVLQDRAAWDKAWSDASGWLKRFFAGELTGGLVK